MYKLFVKILILLLLSTCANKEYIEFYRGERQNAAKIALLCELYNLPVELAKSSDGIAVLKGSKDIFLKYDKILLAAEPYLLKYGSRTQAIELREYFIPKKQNTIATENVTPIPRFIQEKIGNSIYVLGAEISNDLSNEERKSVKLVYVDHPLIHNKVNLLISELQKIDSNQQFIKSPINIDLAFNSETEPLASSLTVLEPFSFRVLNSERNLAGMQFLLLLLLFLLSGFILGLWWRKKP